MNGMQVGGSNLIVRLSSPMSSGTNPNEFLENWLLKKKEEWINQQKGMNNQIDLEELNEKEDSGEMTPWLQELITKYSGDIQSKFREILSLKYLMPQVSIGNTKLLRVLIMYQLLGGDASTIC